MTLSMARPGHRSNGTAQSERVSEITRPPVSGRWLFAGLVLYAALGKGFAYAGWPPVYVGEVLLAVVLAGAVGPWMAFPRNLAALLAACLGGLAAVQFVVDRLASDVPVYETLRGLAPMYYAGYAFGTYALLRAYEQRSGRRVVAAATDRAMLRVSPWAVGVLALLAAFLLVEPPWLPAWPTSGVPILLTKSGDIAVGLVLFAPALFHRRATEHFAPHRLALVVLWCGAALLVTFRGRGALLALVIGLIVMRPHAVRLVKGAMVALALVVVLYVSGLSVEVRNREISYDAIGDAIASTLGAAPEDDIGGNYVGTTSWRVDWWQAIWADVRAENMVLHGHGWGDSLAERYGVGAAPDEADRALRLPHNVFFSLAGRAGVVVAVGFLIVPLLTVAATFKRSRGQPPATTVQAARGAVIAGIVTGLTDVYLEAPQGGIVMWVLLGYLWWATAKPIERAGAGLPARTEEVTA